MKKHTHGGNVYQYQNCIDFSANCNPLGTPERVKMAIIKSLDQIAQYPQVGCERLKRAIADYEQVDKEMLICGNGAAELIFSICRAQKPRKALLPAPTFAEYEQALLSVDCEIERYLLEETEDFKVTDSFFEKLTDELDMIFLCNPNNPTGMLTETEMIKKILKYCREKQIFLVVDECFQDFIKEPDRYTMKPYLKEYDNLFLLKAFTKRYAIPGVRLGYGISGNPALLERMEAMVQPWNVSTIAQEAGMAALLEQDYVEAGRQLIFREKEYLFQEMKKLGLKVYPSEANYIFFHGPEKLFEKCQKRGILIRDCSNYEGLKEGYYRIAVKLPEQNQKLIEVLKEILLEG